MSGAWHRGIHGLPDDADPSPSGLRQFLEGIRAGPPVVNVEIEDTVAEGDRVAARVT
jgi:predicted ester cyclase